MPRYIAFLRAINVGGHVVKMDHLRGLFETLGFANVETVIASGNVIFESAGSDARMLERQIEERLRQALGYDVATFVRSPSELAAIASYRPFADAVLDDDGSSLYVAFLPGTPNMAAQQKLMTFRTETDDFHVHERENIGCAAQR